MKYWFAAIAGLSIIGHTSLAFCQAAPGRGPATAPAARGAGRGAPATPGPAPAAPAAFPRTGAVGVGTWATVSEFKDLKVVSGEKVLWQSDFSKGLVDWQLNSGQWKLVDGALQQSSSNNDCRAVVGDASWGDYVFTLQARKISGNEGFMIPFHVQDAKNYIYLNVGGWNNTRTGLQLVSKGALSEIGQSTNFTVQANRWYDIRIETSGRDIKCFIDGKLIVQTSEAPAPTVRRNAIEAQLKSGEDSKIQAGLADLKKWFTDNRGDAENTLFRLRPTVVSLGDHAAEVQELVALAKEQKIRDKAGNPGYLYVMQAGLLFETGKPEAAIAALQEGMKADAASTRTALTSDLSQASTPHKSAVEFAGQLQSIVAAFVDDPAIAEWALKQRITVFNAEGKYAEALATTKSLFNFSSMAHTADALLLVDRQIIVTNPDDASLSNKFHKEQADGAIAPIAGAQPNVCSVLQGIKVEASAYESALKNLADKSFQDRVRHTLLLLLADRPADAIAVARQAFALAANTAEINAAKELIARCYKAQDGTIGRANAWAAGNLQVAEIARPATQPAAPTPTLPGGNLP